jgi:hypothetical protein
MTLKLMKVLSQSRTGVGLEAPFDFALVLGFHEGGSGDRGGQTGTRDFEEFASLDHGIGFGGSRRG